MSIRYKILDTIGSIFQQVTEILIYSANPHSMRISISILISIDSIEGPNDLIVNLNDLSNCICVKPITQYWDNLSNVFYGA